jgi:tyrosyl-tRNA synthetase (EC 6.1.1.1)
VLTPDKQFEIIKRGTVEIIQEDDLKKKLERSYKEKKPLKIKVGLIQLLQIYILDILSFLKK